MNYTKLSLYLLPANGLLVGLQLALGNYGLALVNLAAVGIGIWSVNSALTRLSNENSQNT